MHKTRPQKGHSQKQISFCYSPLNPNSLVMLYSPEYVLSKMIILQAGTYVVWIGDDIAQTVKKKLGDMEDQGDFGYSVYASLDKAKDFFVNNHHTDKRIVVICSPNISNYVTMLSRTNNPKTIIQYPFPFPSPTNPNPNSINSPQIPPPQSQSHHQANTQQQLIDLIYNIRNTEIKYKDLPNFVIVNGQVWKSNVLARTMMAMIYCQVDIKARREILDMFQKLAKKINKGDKFREFFNQMSKGTLSAKRAIHWYTNSNGIYKMMNNLLRTSTHPSEVFYIQPFFKDIFISIKNLSKHKQQFKDFVCYRGGFLFQSQRKELQKNIGSIVKNLCFFSTSLDLDTALKFKKNVIFEIFVNQSEIENKQSQYDFGYASVKEHSCFFGEEEILFNPMNSFKLLEIVQYEESGNQNWYTVKLQYGNLTKIMHKNDTKGYNSLTESEKSVFVLGKIWKEESQIQCQGQVFVTQSQNLAKGSQYWQKYIEIAKSCFSKCFGLLQLSKYYLNIGNSIQAEKLLSEANSILKQNYGDILDSILKKQLHQLETYKKDIYIGLNQKIQIQLANAFSMSGSHKKSQQIYKKICDVRLKLSGDSHSVYHMALNNLALSYQSMREFEKAGELFELCSNLRLKFRGKYHPESIGTQRNLATNYQKIGNNKKARELYKNCLKLFQTMLGKEHPKYVTTLICLASTYSPNDQSDKILPIYQKCCDLAQKVLTQRHPDYLTLLNNYVAVLDQLRRNKQISKVYSKFLKMQNEREQSDHEKVAVPGPNYLQYLNNVSKAHSHFKTPKKSLEYSKQCTDLAFQMLGQSHPEYLCYLGNLAKAYEKMGQYQTALQLYRKCQGLVDRHLGKSHSFYSVCVNSLADCLRDLGRYREAVVVLEECCVARKLVLGDNDPLYLDSLINLANIYHYLNLPHKSLPILQESLSISTSLNLPQTHPKLLLLQNNLATCLLSSGKYKQAEPLYTKCLKLRLELVGDRHPQYLVTLNGMGNLWYCQGRYSRAILCYRWCCGIWGEVGDCGGEYMMGLNNMAMSYLCLGEYNKSIQVQTQCCKHSLSKLGPNHPTHHNFLKNLATISQNLGNPKKALTLYSLIAKSLQSTHPHSHPHIHLSQQPQYLYILNNIIILYCDMGKYRKAMKVMGGVGTGKSIGRKVRDRVRAIGRLGKRKDVDYVGLRGVGC